MPIVADYTIPIPAPVISGVSVSGSNLVMSVTNGITNDVYVVLTSTNISSPVANWTAVASNTASAGNFTVTATNAFSPSVPVGFFTLQTR